MASSYPCPSALNPATFLTAKPCLVGADRSSFKIWRKQMLCLLESQDLLGFVDGSITPPLDSDHQKLWRRSDTLIQGWMFGSIGTDALHSVWDKQTARDVWLQLDYIFNDSDERGEDDSGTDFSRFLELYKAAQQGNWFTALNFFPDINELCTTVISWNSETVLHVAVKTGGRANDLVKKLVEHVPREALAQKQCDGDTALHYAAIVGNVEAAKALVDKHPDLLYALNNRNRSPLVEAAVHCQKRALQYLIACDYNSKTMLNPFQGQLGIHLLNSVIASEFLDIALDLAVNHPNLTRLIHDDGDSALSTLSRMRTLFPRKECFTWWQNRIYHRIPVKAKEHKYDAAHTTSFDIESLTGGDMAARRDYSPTFQISVLQKMESMMWNGMEHLLPKVKEIRQMKETHQKALQLAEYLCQKLSTPNVKEASTIFETSIINATKYGISEIVEMIMHAYPMATSHMDVETGMNVFLLAASYRFEDVINLFYNMSDHKHMFYDNTDDNDNNLMHICAKLGPPDRLNLVSGAALQMQRELQWFKEMGNLVNPSRRSRLNKEKQTPEMIFTKEHEKLKEEGEKWIKGTANACSITAALIVTIMFAAAFTMPGGINNATRDLLFHDLIALDVFAHSDAIALFGSIFSLLMFLSILTSRYAEEDFLYVLPTKLTLGLLSLFVSITAMMVAFCYNLSLLPQGGLLVHRAIGRILWPARHIIRVFAIPSSSRATLFNLWPRHFRQENSSLYLLINLLP